MTSDNQPDIAQAWRQQPPGRQTMSLEEIRATAKAFDLRTKRWRDVGGLTIALLLVKNAWEVWTDIEVVERAGDLLIFLALVYVVYRGYRFAGTHLTPSKLGLTTCAEHYRAQLVRQRELSGDGWQYVLPFGPGLGLMIGARMLEGRPASQVAMLIVIASATFVGVLWTIARRARTLEREIAALD